MKASNDVIYRNIAGEHVLIPVGSIAVEYNGMFVMTELGAQIWNMIKNGMEKEEIFASLFEQYEVEEKTLRTDINEFLEKLVEAKLIEI